MRILHLASEFPPQQVFGLGRFVRDLAEEQVRQKHEVTVITNNFGGKLADTTVNGVRVLRVDHPNPPKPAFMTGCVMIFNILVLRRALDLGPEQLKRFNVVCSHDWLSAPAAQALSRTFGMPHVSTFHDTTIGKRLGDVGSPVDQFAVDLERWVASSATHVIANSNATKRELIERYGISSQRMTVVPCAVAPATFETMNDLVRIKAFRRALVEDDERIVLYVGRLDREKGVDVLLKAFAEAHIPKARLLIAGQSGGQWAEELLSLTRSLGMDPDDIFLGYVENPALGHLYHAADVLVCPSLYEPFGMVAIEGMLQGTPVIASDTGGLADLVEVGVNGLKAKAGDTDSLRVALTRMMSDEPARQRMGVEAREIVLRERTWTHACKQTTEVYRGLSRRRSLKQQASAKRLFVGPDGTRPEAYAVELQALALLKSCGESESPARVSAAGADGLIKLKGITLQEDRLIDAFNMAARLIEQAASPPEELISFHWVGALAASVLQRHRGVRRRVYFCPPIPCAPEAPKDGTGFDAEIPVWAAMQDGDVYVPDDTTRNVVAQFGGKGVVREFPTIKTGSVSLSDEQAFRSVLASEDELLAVTALRLDPPFSINALVMAAHAARAIGLRVRWIVCGDGVMAPRLREAIEAEKMPASILGFVPKPVLESILKVADLAIVVRSDTSHTLFVEEALARRIPTVVPRGYPHSRKASECVMEADFANGDSLMMLFDRVTRLDGCARYRIQSSSQSDGTNGSRDSPAKTAAATAVSTGVSAIGSGSEAPSSPATKVVHQGPSRPISDRSAATAKSDYALFNDWGIGDELLLSAVAREIVRERPDVRVWIRSRHGFRFPPYCQTGQPPADVRWVETVYQNAVLYGPTHHAPFPGHLVQQMLDKFALDTGIVVRAKDVRPEVLLSSHILSLRAPGSVVLHARPNPRLPSKDWGLPRWEALCQLLHDRGVRLRQVGAKDEPLLPFVEDLRGTSVADLPTLIAGCGVVVCVTGLLMHIAAATGTPAVVIYGGREHPAIDGYAEHVHLCCDPLPCRGRWGCHLAPDHQCPHTMRCMTDISPQLVLYETTTLLNRL